MPRARPVLQASKRPVLQASKMRGNKGSLSSDMAKRPEIEFDYGTFPEPVGRR